MRNQSVSDLKDPFRHRHPVGTYLFCETLVFFGTGHETWFSNKIAMSFIIAIRQQEFNKYSILIWTNLPLFLSQSSFCSFEFHNLVHLVNLMVLTNHDIYFNICQCKTMTMAIKNEFFYDSGTFPQLNSHTQSNPVIEGLKNVPVLYGFFWRN